MTRPSRFKHASVAKPIIARMVLLSDRSCIVSETFEGLICRQSEPDDAAGWDEMSRDERAKRVSEKQDRRHRDMET